MYKSTVRATLSVALWILTGCAPPIAEPSKPANTSEPPPSANASSGKRVPCTFGADQSCNEDPRVSSIWGRCTELGTCECNTGFELGPSGYCRPQK